MLNRQVQSARVKSTSVEWSLPDEGVPIYRQTAKYQFMCQTHSLTIFKKNAFIIIILNKLILLIFGSTCFDRTFILKIFFGKNSY